MDFLDPKKKRSQSIKLAIGHFLMLVLVAVGTFILVLQAYGFDLDRKTGEVIQNGLVFVDSAPDGAEIKLNGEVKSEKTNTRLSLPEGNYKLEINKEGYRTWQKEFSLFGGSIERFTYPTLFLKELKPSELQVFEAPINFMTQSLDRRWVIIGAKNNLSSFTVYDLNTRQNQIPTRQALEIPGGLLTAAAGDHTLKVVEWSSDNKNFLVSHTFQGGQEFVIINHDEPAKSININQQLDQNPNDVALFDKKIERLYVHDTKTKVLSTVNLKTKASSAVANNVINFKPHGDNTILLAQSSATDKKKAQIAVLDDEKTYVVREVAAASKIPLAIARYDDAWFVAGTDPADQRTYIYRNPVEFISKQPELKATPVMVLKNTGPVSDLLFSGNAEFIMARSGQNFSVYDAEYDRRYNFDVKDMFDKNSEVLWLDGHRLLARSAGKVEVFEFDGQNKQTLVSSLSGLPAGFDRDYTEVYTLTNSTAAKGEMALTKTDLRLEVDK